MDGIAGLIAKAGLPGQLLGEPPLFDAVFTDGTVQDYRATLRADRAIAAHVNKVLRERGIMKGESKFYVSLAHGQRDIDQTLDAYAEALRKLPG